MLAPNKTMPPPLRVPLSLSESSSTLSLPEPVALMVLLMMMTVMIMMMLMMMVVMLTYPASIVTGLPPFGVTVTLPNKHDDD